MRSLYKNLLKTPFRSKRFKQISLSVLTIPVISRQYALFNTFSTTKMGGSSSAQYPVEKSDDEWRAILSPEQVVFFFSF